MIRQRRSDNYRKAAVVWQRRSKCCLPWGFGANCDRSWIWKWVETSRDLGQQKSSWTSRRPCVTGCAPTTDRLDGGAVVADEQIQTFPRRAVYGGRVRKRTDGCCCCWIWGRKWPTCWLAKRWWLHRVRWWWRRRRKRRRKGKAERQSAGADARKSDSAPRDGRWADDQSCPPEWVDAGRRPPPPPNRCATMELLFFSNGQRPLWFAVAAP